MMRFFIVTGLVMFLFSCNDKPLKNNYDSPLKGEIRISVDESIKPVMEQQIKVFHAAYPNTNIVAEYKPEVACLRDLQNDSTRMVVVTKGLSADEFKLFKNKIGFEPVQGVLAKDAVAVIINKESPDSFYTINQLKDLLSGKNSDKEVVVDGNNATSTVRFLLDSVLKGSNFGTNVKAANGSKAVLELVSSNKNLIGFVGLSWIGNAQDPEQAAFQKKIKYAWLPCEHCNENDTYAKPSQQTIMFKQYPLIRNVYYILKENRTGLGNGFVEFMSFERGQLIFRRAGLAPAKMNFQIRKGSISNDD